MGCRVRQAGCWAQRSAARRETDGSHRQDQTAAAARAGAGEGAALFILPRQGFCARVLAARCMASGAAPVR